MSITSDWAFLSVIATTVSSGLGAKTLSERVNLFFKVAWRGTSLSGIIMVKRAVVELEGCSRAVVEEAIRSLVDFTEDVFIETAKGLHRVKLYIRSASKKGDCWEVNIGLRSTGGWLWGEVFEVCVYEEGHHIRISLVRRRGVGRINADVLGLWIAEWTERTCGGLMARIVEKF